MKAYLEFATVPTADTPGTTLLLHYDSKRYMIGRVGEGTQRAWVERGISMRKLEHIFLTGKTGSENLGGILGMILTLADAKQAQDSTTAVNGAGEKPTLGIIGGSNLLQAIAAARRFIFRKGLPLNVKEVKPNAEERASKLDQPIFADENIRVWSMVIQSDRPTKPESPTLNSRKRTFDQLNGVEQSAAEINGAPAKGSDADRESRYDTLRKAVVHDMFGSSWSLDCLMETPLRDVKPPTKVWIRDHDEKGMREYTGPLPGGPIPLPDPDLRVLVRTPWPGALVSALPPTTPKEEAVSYIVRPWPRRGKFDSLKARELGVPFGPVRNQLANGESVTLANGKVITPDMIIGEDREGSGFMVVDLPSNDYVAPLLASQEWGDTQLMENVGAVVWILGPGVASNAELQRFIAAQSDRKHVFAGPDVCPNELAFESSATSAVHLAQMDIDNFPIPHFDNITTPQASFRSQNQQPILQLTGADTAARGLQLHIEPSFVVQKDAIRQRLDTYGLLAKNDESYISLARNALESTTQGRDAAEIERWKASLPKPGADVEVIALGTGSALPSKYRNVSATLVRVPGYGSYLLDCGENTLGQLQRTFSPKELREVLQDLRMIWISHLHADHHLGTVSLIKAWHSVVHGDNPKAPPMSPDTAKDLQNPTLIQLILEKTNTSRAPYLPVVSHPHMLHYLSEYSYIEDFGYSHLLPLAITGASPETFEPKKTSVLQLSHNKCPVEIVNPKLLPTLLGIQDIQAVLVPHCRGAMAVAITFPTPTPNADDLNNILTDSAVSADPTPFKLAYSGDTRPSIRFAAIGMDATVLIHEATFDDELQAEAVAKKHSTTSEALMVAAEMQARSVVLTHFSQRYQKIPVFDVRNFGTGLEGAAVEEEESEVVGQEEQVAGQEAYELDGTPHGSEPHQSHPDGEDGPAFLSHDELDPSQAKGASDLVQSKRRDSNPFNSLNPELAHEDQRTVRKLFGKAARNDTILYSPTRSSSARAGDVGGKDEKVAKARDMKVCVAFDYMRVKVGDIPRVAALRPALMALFAEETKEEEKAEEISGKGGQKNGRTNGRSENHGGGTSKKQQKRLEKQKSRGSLRDS